MEQTLRNRVENTIDSFLQAYQREGLKDYCPGEIAHNLTDYVFDALDITREQQDIKGAEVKVQGNTKEQQDIKGAEVKVQGSTKEENVGIKDIMDLPIEEYMRARTNQSIENGTWNILNFDDPTSLMGAEASWLRQYMNHKITFTEDGYIRISCKVYEEIQQYWQHKIQNLKEGGQ